MPQLLSNSIDNIKVAEIDDRPPSRIYDYDGSVYSFMDIPLLSYLSEVLPILDSIDQY